MSPGKPLNTKEITELLSKLKAQTPEYPSELMEARKAAFLKQAVNIKIDRTGQGGEGGNQGGSGGSGGSGTVLGSGSVPGVLLQALIGIAVVTALLLGAYAYRNQFGDNSQNTKVSVEEVMPASSQVAPETVTVIPGSATPVLTVSPTAGTPTPTEALLVLDDPYSNGTLVAEEIQTESAALTGTQTNNGLHLGQTPGAPAAPGQGNPGNANKPDKPVKPEKTKKPKKD